MKHLNFLLISTFIAGFFTGFYVFFTNRASDGSLVPQREDVGTEIIADSYGGCESLGCMSYHIAEDGHYTFVQQGLGREDARYEDVISKNRMTALMALIEEADLKDMEESIFVGVCPVVYDGVAYRFQITYEGEQYDIDTCVHETATSALIVELQDYFQIFTLTHGGQ